MLCFYYHAVIYHSLSLKYNQKKMERLIIKKKKCIIIYALIDNCTVGCRHYVITEPASHLIRIHMPIYKMRMIMYRNISYIGTHN